jgi:hypothetical protein
VIYKFATSLLLFYFYKLKSVCLSDEQAVYKQESVQVKPKARHVCQNTCITFNVFRAGGI